MNKYNAIAVRIDGYRFASTKESKRYKELKVLLNAKEIKDLELQPNYPIVINGFKICTYRADFRYVDVKTGETVVEDVKGFKTAIYKLKKKMVKAVHGIDIKEI